MFLVVAAWTTQIVFAILEQTSPSVADNSDCRTPPVWRYSSHEGRHTDVATATFQSEYAWYAISAGATVPYRFSSQTPEMDHQFLQVDFLAPTRIIAMQTAGRVGVSRDNKGMVNVFKVAFKTPEGKWRYYADNNGATQLFTIVMPKEADESTPAIFKLPFPIVAEGIRIYIKKFVDMPYMAIDLKACYLKSSLELSDCTRSLLNAASRPVPVAFVDLKPRGKNTNFRRYNTITLSDDEPRLVTQLVAFPPEHGGRVKTFVLEYLDSTLAWRNVVDKDGVIKIFKPGPRRGKLYSLPLPVSITTRVLRLFPEEWETTRPKISIDVRGCLPQVLN